jgi:hypothetical protein
MEFVRLLAGLVLVVGGPFGFILVMHYYVPPLLRGWISVILLLLIAIDALYEWLSLRREKAKQ